MKKLSVILFLGFICFGLFVRSAFTESDGFQAKVARLEELTQKAEALNPKLQEACASSMTTECENLTQEAKAIFAEVTQIQKEVLGDQMPGLVQSLDEESKTPASNPSGQ